MTAVKPGRPRSEQADVAILEATLDLLDEAGYPGVTIEGVAQRAGVAKTTVYRRWSGKDELVYDALQRIKGPIPQIPHGPSVRDDLLQLILDVRTAWSDTRHGRIMRRLTAEGGERPEQYREFRDRLVVPRQRAAIAVLNRGIEQGLIRPDADLPAVVDLLTAPIVLSVLTHRGAPTVELVGFVVDTVLRGIAV